MPIDKRKANWRFDALWAFPLHMAGSTDFTNRKKLLEELDSLLKRDLVDRSTFPTYISSVELNYKLSDLEVAHTNSSTQLPVTGYIQSAPGHKIDSDNLLRWYTALWSPIDGQLVRIHCGTTPIATGTDKTLHIIMYKCTACRVWPSPNAVPAGNRLAQIQQTC